MSEAYVPPSIQGRGAAGNPQNRFERLSYEPDPDAPPDESGAPRTELFRDVSRSILSKNDSPDVPFTFSVNPYRGCEHGCIYCYARPTHEYLGFSAGLDFETRLLVKEDAPRLLREELLAPKWKPETVVMSGVTDAYQPVERRLGLARRCLEVFAELPSAARAEPVVRCLRGLGNPACHLPVGSWLAGRYPAGQLLELGRVGDLGPAYRQALKYFLHRSHVPVSPVEHGQVGVTAHLDGERERPR